MTARQRLPNRRASTFFDFTSMNVRFTASISRDAEGRVLELFCDNHKASSAVGTLVQHGADIDAIRRALCRDSSGRALGPIGAALDLLADKEGRRL